MFELDLNAARAACAILGMNSTKVSFTSGYEVLIVIINTYILFEHFFKFCFFRTILPHNLKTEISLSIRANAFFSAIDYFVKYFLNVLHHFLPIILHQFLPIISGPGRHGRQLG